MKNPWIGLRPFEAEEQSLFFGRDREVRVLSSLVATLPILVIYAPSGTGKSSLLNAGLTPEIMDDAYQELVLVGTDQDALSAVQAGYDAHGWGGSRALGLAELMHAHWLDTDRRTIVVLDQFEER